VVDVARAKGNDDDGEDAAEQAEPGDVAADEDGKPEEDGKPAKKPRSFWKELPILIGIALVLTFLIQTFIARVFLIPSESMEQTLHGCAGCYGDRVLVDKVVYAFSDPEPGDVVVFERPSTWGRSEFQSNRSDNAVVRWLQDLGAMFGLASPDEDDVVKRVIAVGGQTVECCDDQGRVMVDGKSLDEPYIYWENGVPGVDTFGPVRVPDGRLWVMGDNRANSNDSRRQGDGREGGTVPVDNVIGKARFIVLPPSRWQGVGDHNAQAAAVAAAVQVGIPAGVGFAAAWPVLWLGRRARATIRSGRR
jgi:signal peptidase I